MGCNGNVAERPNLVWIIQEDVPKVLMMNLKSRENSRVFQWEHSITWHSIKKIKNTEYTALLCSDNWKMYFIAEANGVIGDGIRDVSETRSLITV